MASTKTNLFVVASTKNRKAPISVIGQKRKYFQRPMILVGPVDATFCMPARLELVEIAN